MTDTEYYDLIRPYDDAMKLLLTRLEILNHNIYKASAENPIHTMQYRIKSKQSIEEKLIRKGEEPTLENAKDLLQDIAGIRIVCYFVGDIKNLIDMLKKQSDLIFIRERDYITNPKPNGYRSHHIILGVNVFCLDASEYYPVEIQLRTISMDFWAAMEHRICYKSKPFDELEMKSAFRQNAEARRPSAEAEAPAAAGAAHAAETPDGARRCDCDFVRLYGSESFFEHLSACKQRLAAGIAAPARVGSGRARAAPDRSGAVAQRHAAGASRCEGRAVAAGADD